MPGSFLFWERFLLADRQPALRYGVAAGLAVASVYAAGLLHWLDKGEVASLALATVVLSGIYGGLGPALLDTAITSVGIEFATRASAEFGYMDSAFRIALHGAVGFLIADITGSLRTAYRQLRRENAEKELATRAREDVLAVVSHDLRSPLSAIKLAVEVLHHASRGGRRASDDHRMLESIRRSADQMHRIVDDLLDAVRIEKGQFRITRASRDLSPIVEDALQSVRTLAEARAIRLRPRLPSGEAYIECDRARMVQALSNLLHNAVKFSPDGGFVDVTAALHETHATISVRDYGGGIGDDLKASLFDRYRQGARTAHQGTGLGLFIAKSIIEAHGGQIELESREGYGACFTVRLPRTPDADRPHQAAGP